MDITQKCMETGKKGKLIMNTRGANLVQY